MSNLRRRTRLYRMTKFFMTLAKLKLMDPAIAVQTYNMYMEQY